MKKEQEGEFPEMTLKSATVYCSVLEVHWGNSFDQGRDDISWVFL